MSGKNSKRGGRGRGADMGSRQATAPGDHRGGRVSGAGRGIPDYKDGPNPSIKRTGTMGSSANMGKEKDETFNSEEAHNWIQNRYKGVLEQMDKYKSAGGAKGGEIQSFGDHNNTTAWAGSKPILPRNEDFLYQVQRALGSLRDGN